MSAGSAASALCCLLGLGGGLAFVVSLLAFGYTYVVPFGAPAGAWTPAVGVPAVLWNAAWFALFAVHHSLLARTRIKSLVLSRLPDGLERTSYVLVASGLFVLVVRLWAPVPGTVWAVSGIGAALLTTIQLVAVGVTLRAASRVDVLELAGIRQACGMPGRTPVGLLDTGLYGMVRHPIYLAWLLLVWPVPVMTATRLTFAVLSTAYLVAAIPLEERALLRTFGRTYADYRRRVRWRMVPFVY